MRIVQDTREIMQRTLDQYGTGLEVVNVNITDVQVPEAVQAAQRDSVKASADRERMVKEAQAYANNILPVAEGNAARDVQDAEAYKSQVVSMATGEASRFTQLALAYEKAPAVTRERLYLETRGKRAQVLAQGDHRFEGRQRQHDLPAARQAHGTQPRVRRPTRSPCGRRSASRPRRQAPNARQRVER